MKAIQNNKGIVVAIIVFLIAIFVYKSFFSPDPSNDVSVTASSTVDVGSDLVSLNSSLQFVTLDTSLFNSPAYRSLIDFSSDLGTQPTGRHDPFSVIGSDK